MEQQLQTIREKALAQLAEAQDTAALEQLRVSVLGKKGELTGILRGMGKLPAEERPKMGQMVNETRAAIEEALEARAEKLETEALTEAALTSNRFGGKLLGVRKQVSALARYAAQLEDMFEDLSDAAQEAALAPAEARSLALSGERAHR